MGLELRYHQVRKLERIWEFHQFSPEAKKATAAAVLQLWKESGRDSSAGRFLQQLVALDVEEVGIEDLPGAPTGNGERGVDARRE